MRSKSFILTISIMIFGINTQSQNNDSTFTDSRDGKIYKIVTIGNQTWMAQNLAYKPKSKTDCWLATHDTNSTSPYGFWAYQNDTSNVKIYGYLYCYYTAQIACPLGWHLSTYKDWEIMIKYFGGDSVAGGKLKEKDTTYWASPNKWATNESGFSALPGGSKSFDKNFANLGFVAYWWIASEQSELNAPGVGVGYITNNILAAYVSKSYGYSVRCVKDK